MRYQSTRNKNVSITAAQAITQGLASDGGPFVPETIPQISLEEINNMVEMGYKQRATAVMSLFLDGFTNGEVKEFTDGAYNDKTFDCSEIAPVRKLYDGTHFLELWHGPTCAFKDMALQILPRFLTASLLKTGDKREVCILVATSGDTGKAALAGFCDVDRTKIMVFYPENGVSDIQKLQMVTQSGKNVGVCAVKGNFDDAQTGVKKIFSDTDLRNELNEKNWFLSSANSINWGRLLPQIVYYISAYCDLLKAGDIELGDKVNFAVPTGNFGDILAGYYGKTMGLPIKKLICASNMNNVLTDFIETGIYDKNRRFYTTMSPSMDILVSSNLERLLFELSGKNDTLISSYMTQLSGTGKYEVTPELKAAVADAFSCGFCTEEQTADIIKETFDKYNYLIDTHTAVGYHVLREYRAASGDTAPAIVVSTASPYKFTAAVLTALGLDADSDGLTLIERLSEATGTAAPEPLKSLRGKQIRFNEVTEKDDMIQTVKGFIM